MSADARTAVQMANVELVEKFLAVLIDEGLVGIGDRADEFWSPDLEWRPAMLSFGREVYRGIDEYHEYLREAVANAGGNTNGGLAIDEVVARGDDRVLALGGVRYEGKEGEEPSTHEYGLLVTLADGRFVSARSFLSHASALKAADADA